MGVGVGWTLHTETTKSFKVFAIDQERKDDILN